MEASGGSRSGSGRYGETGVGAGGRAGSTASLDRGDLRVSLTHADSGSGSDSGSDSDSGKGGVQS